MLDNDADSGAPPEGPASADIRVAGSRLERIRDALQIALQPSELELEDQSHLHAGHAGARDGKGHFRVRIVAQRFAGLRAIARHQLIYQFLADLLRTDIHALSITALTPDEVHSSTAGHFQKS